MTPKQQRFADLYDGNGTKAAREAGYAGSDNTLAQTARALLRNPHVRKAIDERNKGAARRGIATREERQRFWSASMQNPEVDLKDRLKASELLGKSEADFTEKHVVDAGPTLETLVLESMGRKVEGA